MYARANGHRRIFSRIGVAIYAVFLVVSSFQHHDLLCHLKSPQHCTACTSTQLSADPSTPALDAACHLADAGRAVIFQPVSAGVLLAARSTGRSPPRVS